MALKIGRGWDFWEAAHTTSALTSAPFRYAQTMAELYALFYRTLNGAQVGDLFMSLIHTCQLCGANSFDYLTELQRHAQELATKPAEWMPWNYRETLERIVSLSDSA